MNVGEVHDSVARETLIRRIIQETQELAKKTDKIRLDNTILMRHARRSNASKDYGPSMLLDQESGCAMKIKAILGNTIRRANKIIKLRSLSPR
jgi:ketopantoate reductase